MVYQEPMFGFVIFTIVFCLLFLRPFLEFYRPMAKRVLPSASDTTIKYALIGVFSVCLVLLNFFL